MIDSTDNQFETIDNYNNKASDLSVDQYGSTASSDASFGSVSKEDLFEEGTAVEGVLNFVKANWMMILGAGAVIGVGAYLFRNGLPFSLGESESEGTSSRKKSGRGRSSHAPSKIAQIKGGHSTKANRTH